MNHARMSKMAESKEHGGEIHSYTWTFRPGRPAEVSSVTPEEFREFGQRLAEAATGYLDGKIEDLITNTIDGTFRVIEDREQPRLPAPGAAEGTQGDTGAIFGAEAARDAPRAISGQEPPENAPETP